MGSSLIPTAQQAVLDNLLDSVWNTLKRPLQVYTTAQVAYISTTTANPRFAQHDQNVFNPAVNPQVQTIQGIIRYPKQQPWEYIEPGSRSNYQQSKVRNSEGETSIKVDSVGYEILRACKQVVVDGSTFTLDSTPRPNTLFTPRRWTFRLLKVD